MGNFSYTAQDVNGDPASSGGNINIVSGSQTAMEFQDVDDILGITQTGERVSLDGGQTFLNYEFLGYGEVRGDNQQVAGFLKIDLGDGSFQTFAIDMDYDGDGVPNLQNGNTKLKVGDLTPTPPPVCFVTGTLIDTAKGRIPVEALRVGDEVLTLDHGLQPVRAISCEKFRATGDYAPIRFEVGAIDNTEPLLVSPQHRIYLAGWLAELYFAEESILVPAIGLVNDTTIRRMPGGQVAYVHLLFDQHEIVWGAGALSESFFAEKTKFETDLANPTQAELFRLFPDLRIDQASEVTLARPQVRRRDAQVLRPLFRAA
ncbi:MAG: Hint domain-containing protein [Yoonia sp.]|nr:Hint domain-containing protein [Yoonia sp.]